MAGFTKRRGRKRRHHRSWPDDHRGHKKASKLGWRRRRRTAKRDASYAHSWPDDHRGHKKASKLGWRRRRRSRDQSRSWEGHRAEHQEAAHRGWMNAARPGWAPKRPTYKGMTLESLMMPAMKGMKRKGKRKSKRSWPDDHRGHKKASKLGWRRRRRSRRDLSRSWEGHPVEHSTSSHLGWKRVGGPGWHPKRPVYKGPLEAKGRLARRHRKKKSRRDLAHSWPDDYRGHSKASRKGWRRKRRG